MPIVRKIWEDEGLKWERTQNFVLDRIPINLRRYIFAAPRAIKGGLILEALSPTGIVKTLLFAAQGFVGLG